MGFEPRGELTLEALVEARAMGTSSAAWLRWGGGFLFNQADTVFRVGESGDQTHCHLGLKGKECRAGSSVGGFLVLGLLFFTEK